MKFKAIKYAAGLRERGFTRFKTIPAARLNTTLEIRNILIMYPGVDSHGIVNPGQVLSQMKAQAINGGHSVEYVPAIAGAAPGNPGEQHRDAVLSAIRGNAEYVFLEYPETFLPMSVQIGIFAEIRKTAVNPGRYFVLTTNSPWFVGDLSDEAVEL